MVNTQQNGTNPYLRRAVIALAVLASVLLMLHALRGAIVGLVFALIIAYLMDPIIDRFEGRGISRSAAIGVCVTLLMALGGLVVVIVLPMVVQELADLRQNLGTYLGSFREQVQVGVEWMNTRFGTEMTFDGDFLDSVQPLLANVDPAALDPLTSVLWALGSSTVGMLLAVINFTLVPVYSFYFLRDFDKMKAAALDLVPRRWREITREIFIKIDRLMGQFIRGQLTICAILAVLYSLGLVLIAQIDLAVLVGVSSGALFIVPYLGTIFGIVTATALCLIKWGFDWHLIGVLITFGGAQLIEVILLTPRILGDSTGLHPVVVILSLIIGASLFGFMGMLLAVPTAAASKVVIDQLEARYRVSGFYNDGEVIHEIDEGASLEPEALSEPADVEAAAEAEESTTPVDAEEG